MLEQPSLPPFWPHKTKSRFVQVDSIRWHLTEFPCEQEPTDSAETPVVLMVHGTAASSHSWHGVAPQLARHYKVVCVDLPGHHLTRIYDPNLLTLKNMAMAIERLIAHEGWSLEAIVGHSAGAAVMIKLAGQLSQPPRALVSIAGALTPFGGILAPFFSATAQVLSQIPGLPNIVSLRAKSDRGMRRLVKQTGSDLDDQGFKCMQYLLQQPGHVKSVLRMMANWNLQDIETHMESLNLKFLSIEMANDTAVPPGQAARILASNENAVGLRLEGLGHLGHEEQPERVADEILKFILPAP